MEASDQRNHGIGWFYGRWRRVFAKLQKEKIAVFVQQLRKDHPKDKEKGLVKRVVRRSARFSAAMGVASASPALVPGVGTVIAVAAVLPEEVYLIRRKCIMLLQIAAIYGFDPTEDERLYEILALAGIPSRLFETLMTTKDDLLRISVRAGALVGRTSERRAVFGLKTVSRGLVRRLPVLGVLAGGAINSIAIGLLGRKASRFYRELQKERLGKAPDSGAV